jgi:anti-sigma-K factor RskA
MTEEFISDYYLERYVLGELPEEEAEHIRRRLSEDPELRRMFEDLETSNQEILALYPPAVVKASLLTKLNKWRGKTSLFPLRRIFAVSSALAAVMTLLVLIFPILKKETEIKPLDIGEDIALVKGIEAVDLTKTQLLIFRKTNEKVEMLKDGTQAKQGDLLQLGYVSAEEPYGMILSIDGRGNITLHFPSKKEGSTSLVLRKKSFLSNAIELDDAPAFERFFFITSECEIDVGDILEKADILAQNPDRVQQNGLELTDNYKQYSILIRKGEGS